MIHGPATIQARVVDQDTVHAASGMAGLLVLGCEVRDGVAEVSGVECASPCTLFFGKPSDQAWEKGYWHARSIQFFRDHALIEWLRLPGDVLFIAGVVPLVYMTARSVFRPRPAVSPTR